MDLNQIGEFGLIDSIKATQRIPDGILGIGDDCAVIPRGDGFDSLVTTDMLVEGHHFLLSDVSPYDLGWKSVAVNLSDIAAMGGNPIGTFLSIGLPKGLDSAWTDEFIRGYNEASGGCPLLGGDTTSSDVLCINVAVLGECPHGKALLRSGAKIGDTIYVSGPLGDSGAGLQVILQNLERDSIASSLVHRHYHPIARLDIGRQLIDTEGVNSAMDISDGIASDLLHICEASGVGAKVDVKSIPLSEGLISICDRYGWDAYKMAVSSGEDYELLFTSSKPIAGYYPIGRITAGSGIKWLGSSEEFSGFRHF